MRPLAEGAAYEHFPAAAFPRHPYLRTTSVRMISPRMRKSQHHVARSVSSTPPAVFLDSRLHAVGNCHAFVTPGPRLSCRCCNHWAMLRSVRGSGFRLRDRVPHHPAPRHTQTEGCSARSIPVGKKCLRVARLRAFTNRQEESACGKTACFYQDEPR